MWPPRAPLQQPALLEPSSHVMMTVPSAANHGDCSTAGRCAPSHPSIVCVEQSWPSSQRFGVTHMNAGGDADARSPERAENGTTSPHSAEPVMPVKYMNGSCFFAYSPLEAPPKQGE